MSGKSQRTLTLMVIPDAAGGEVRRVRFSLKIARIVGYVTSAFALGFVGLAIHQVVLLGEVASVPALRAENLRLRSQVDQMEERVAAMARTVERVEQLDARLRQITQLSDPERHLAMGPVGGGEPREDPTRTPGRLKLDLLGADPAARAVALVGDRVSLLESEAEKVETSARMLELYLEEQASLLSATPSLRPAKGWVTSTFGFRTDPYTGLEQMHAGVDISANIGTDVYSTGDGVVVFAGNGGAYGNLVKVDHGHGLMSVYAHLSEIRVKVGQEVKRGSIIAATGNTGRSTGPHLHYEIRLDGIPQNPSRFILE